MSHEWFITKVLQTFHAGITVRFTQSSYSAMENTGFTDVELELVGGTSADPFNVFVIPSEQSPVSAEGNNIMCLLLCVG